MYEKLNQASHDHLDEQSLKKSSVIFRGEKSLTDYQQRINDASYALCQGNPALLLGKKGDLLELARAKVHEDGYSYKKGHSRSKKYKHIEGDEPAVKRVKINAAERQRRIAELSEEISELSKRIAFKDRRIEEATMNRNFRVCDDLASEVSELKAHRRELNAELAGFQQKAKKATYYSKSRKKQQTSTEHTGDDGDKSDAEEVEVIGEGVNESF